MRAFFPAPDVSLLSSQIEAAPSMTRLRELSESFAAASPETVTSILDEAAKFAAKYLAPLNDSADAEGCRIENGRVQTGPGHRAAWDAFVEAGWGTLDQPELYGGQGLPVALAAAVQEIFDRACPAFGMLSVPQRSASKLIAAYGDDQTKAEWLPRLATGEWGATICVSEVEAGSDVGAIRSHAEPNADGSWSVSGEKCWISYGDHDLTSRIGHCILARTPGAAPGGAGLSLFLVPDSFETDGTTVRNAIAIRRIEHKMGLHASPTCALGFEGATGHMIGTEGRGLAQMFVMITNMRLSVGVQGLGIASACADLALQYAEERRQGGPAGAPLAIIEHADVQRELINMVARVEVMRGLAIELANQADLAMFETDVEARTDAAAFVQWLLPIVKTTGGEYAFEVASASVQVLGGAGYTREWPAEQALRDARVLTVYEGTTGIQALDLLYRRLLRGDRLGLTVFLRVARLAQSQCQDPEASRFGRYLDIFDDAVKFLLSIADNKRACDAGATAFLHLASLGATGWIAARLAVLGGNDPATQRLVAAGRYWLRDIDDRSLLIFKQMQTDATALDFFKNIKRI